MPMYEFHCEDCNYTFEELHNLCKGQIKASICPKCKKLVYKIMSSYSFVVNGYNSQNNYAKKGK